MDNRRAVIPLSMLLVVSACTEADLTAPASSPVQATAVPLDVSMSVVAGQDLDFAADLDNIAEVILPGLFDAAAAEALGAQLDALKAHLAAGDRAAAAQVLDEARSVATPDIGNRTDLGYVEMVLYNIEAALAK